jgi:poly-beta-1,6-N-acetyl-D-glucosamine synthase
VNPDPVFWISTALAGYTYAGYPLLALVAARLGGKPCPRSCARQTALTVVVAARDEAARIGARLHNLLDSDYPADLISVLLVDDGSSDATAEEAGRVGDPRIRVLRLARPGGKAAALNAALPLVCTPITVFADARQVFTRETLAALVAPFCEPDVGVVSGELRLRSATAPAHAVAADGMYARIERALRRAEGELGWAHAASGAVYAIRTALFRPIPPGLLLDDVYVPLRAVFEGARVCVAPHAAAYDQAGSDLRREFRRKLRTLVGNWQLIAAQPWLLDPFRNPLFFPWLSHKFLRLVAPWALIGMLVGSAASATPFLRALFWLQLLAYATAGLALFRPGAMRRIPLAAAAGSFVALNWAALLSLPVWLSRRDPMRLWRG